ncbi:MAG: prepilin-type N-terminal cleavage/methylation domain-containing protein [Candidatus Omnitrophica bacterium]|nr:prepilin-type N-terminal cleavage/methylation domain-containing protein [Candidatus Omnitrophota bacterium]
MFYKRDGGVTLTEILVVIIIIAILAALALPQFTASRERALSREAKANLKLISVAEKIYRMREGFYFPFENVTTDRDVIAENLKVNLTEANWDYSIDATNPNLEEFNAFANRTTGPYSGCNYTLGYNITDQPVPGQSCP